MLPPVETLDYLLKSPPGANPSHKSPPEKLFHVDVDFNSRLLNFPLPANSRFIERHVSFLVLAPGRYPS